MIRINGVDSPSTIRDGSTPHSQIGVNHMAANPNLYEPQRNNNFEFIVTDLNNLQKIGSDEVYANAQDIIRLSVESCPIPSFSQSALSVKRGNMTLNYAGVMTFNSGSITLVDYIGADTKGILEAWQYLSGNPDTEKVGHASDYKKDCYLIQYSPDYQVVQKFKMHGCWITGLSFGDMSNTGNDIMKVTANIIYDKATIFTEDII